MATQIRQAVTGGHVPAHDSLKRMIWRWERTGLSTERYQLLYARALAIPPDDLAGPLPSQVSSLSSATDGEDGDGPVNRREFGVTAVGLLAGTCISPARIPESVSAEQVGALREAAARLWVQDGQVGSAVLRSATRYYATARAMLDTSRYTGSTGQDLLAVTAELAACAGFLAFDAAEQAIARSLLTESALLASSAGDSTLTAQAYSLLALQCSSLAAAGSQVPLAREALRFLGQASDAARQATSPRLHALIAMRKATASALLGDEPETRKFITAAHRELDDGQHPSDPHWTWFVTTTEVTAHEAMAQLSLNRPGKAADVFRAVLSDDALRDRNRVYYQARLAGALNAAGDRTQAVSEGLQTLPGLEGPVRSARALNWLRPIRQDAPHDGEFAARFDAVAVS
jgi:hypothetical protein